VSKSTATESPSRKTAAAPKASAAKPAKPAAATHAEPAGTAVTANKKVLPPPFPEPMHVIKPAAKPDPRQRLEDKSRS
jgi:hypothetical protein